MGEPDTRAPLAGGSGWAGTLTLSLTRAVYAGAIGNTDLHRHHAVQVCVALERPLLLRTGPTEDWRAVTGVVVRPDVPHQIDGGGARHLLVYLDPEAPDGRRLVPVGRAALAPLAGEVVAGLRACALGSRDGEDRTALHAAVARCLALTPLARRPLDPRVAQVLAAAKADPQRFASVGAIAAEVGISPRRLRDLFARDTGVSCRRLLLWLRLFAAVRQLASERTLTDAAHAAGFADSAHLSRTFRAMFGISPSTFGRVVRFVDVEE